jgi:hypothetical protein
MKYFVIALINRRTDVGGREYLIGTHTGIGVFRKTFWFFSRRMSLRFDCPYCRKRELKHWNLAKHMEKETTQYHVG